MKISLPSFFYDLQAPQNFIYSKIDIGKTIPLKVDAIPTIFLHNSQTIPKKRVSSIRSETKAAKQQVRLFSMINFASFLLFIAFKHCFL